MSAVADAISPCAPSLTERIAAYDWDAIGTDLCIAGRALLPRLLRRDECMTLRGMYADAENFRSRVVMARHNFGQGEYQYFRYPLPDIVVQARTELYAPLQLHANRWYQALRLAPRFPATLAEFMQQCHDAGQTQPTPLLLKYRAGDFNCLHQDVYGEQVFPLQVAVLLSEPQREFNGGEFVLTEQRPRMQSRVDVVPLRQGDAVVFAVRERPVRGSRGIYRTQLQHGVSRLRSGERYTLGIIFHDAT